MSQFTVAGACPIFVGTGASFAYAFLGFARNGVRINVQTKMGRVESDVMGPELYSDAQFMGREASVSFELSRYVPGVLEILEAITASATSITAGATAGAIPVAAQGAGIGTLMVGEGAAVPLCIVNPYQAAKSGQSTNAACYTFAAAWLDGPVERENSTIVTYPRISFQCINVPNFVTGAALLYTHTLPGALPSIT